MEAKTVNARDGASEALGFETPLDSLPLAVLVRVARNVTARILEATIGQARGTPLEEDLIKLRMVEEEILRRVG